MALVVKHVTGPDAGHELRIEESDNEVTFGRASDADIGFPAELTIVSRDHFRLRREVGSYKFVISKERPVFMNGRPVIDGQELPRVAEVQISGPNGPKLRIERVDAGYENLPKTEVLRGGQDIGDIVTAQRAGGRRLAGWLAAVTALVAVAAGGIYLVNRDVQTTQGAVTQVQGQVADVQGQVAAVNAKVADIDAKIPKLSEQIASAQGQATGPTAPDVTALIAANKESVYRVSQVSPGGQEMGSATAWVILMPDGTKALATNSHVAAMYEEVQGDPELKGFRVVVTQPKGPDFRQLTVTGARKHPAYDVFDQFWYDFMTSVEAGETQMVEIMSGYDVGLLFVDDPAALGEPLKLAPPAKLAGIAAGQRTILIGYPAENTNGTDWTRPEPTSQQGFVTANTSFFLSKDSYEENQLVQHSTPSAGGASGSPIFNVDGEVIGLHSAGSYAILKLKEDEPARRIGSSALVNYAQRVDLLQEVIDGTAEAKVGTYRAFWAASALRLGRKPEDMLADIIGQIKAQIPAAANMVEVATLSGKAERLEAGLKARVAVFDVKIEKPGRYFIVGWSGDRRRVVTMLFDGTGKTIAKGVGGSFQSYISPLVKIDAAGNFFIALVDDFGEDPATDTRPPADMTMKIYYIPPG